MRQFFWNFWREERNAAGLEGDRGWRSENGQSLVEYCILLTWTCLAMMALINAAASGTHEVWTVANRDLATANASAS